MPPRVLVTGGSGKVGRAALDELLAHGYEVVNVDRVRPADPPCPTVLADLADFGRFVDLLSGFDALVHLAAIPAPGLAGESETFENNLRSTFHAFRAAVVLGLDRVVWASSETTFGLPLTDHPPAAAPLTEDAPPCCASSYALSKLLGERAGEQFHLVHGLKSVALRFTNVMGPGDYAPFPTWQDDPAARAWNAWGYVDARDCAQACRLALEADLTGAHVVSVTADDTVMERPSAALMAEVFPDAAVADLPHPRATLISNDRAKALLGYRPRHDWRRELGR